MSETGAARAHESFGEVKSIDKGSDIYGLCKNLYDGWGLSKMDREDSMVRQISVWAGNLEESVNLTLSLFDTKAKTSKIQSTIDSLNERFGDHTIRNGFLTNGPNLKTVPNGFMADRYERQKLTRVI
jgi:hypothetical protein